MLSLRTLKFLKLCFKSCIVIYTHRGRDALNYSALTARALFLNTVQLILTDMMSFAFLCLLIVSPFFLFCGLIQCYLTSCCFSTPVSEDVPHYVLGFFKS